MTGVLFDLDLTLVEYDPAVPGLFREGCRRVGVEPDDALFDCFNDQYGEHFRALDGDPFVRAAADVVAARDLDVAPERFADALVTAEREAAWVPDPVRRTVGRLAADHALAVVTQGYGPVQRGKLQTVGLAAHVDAVITPDQVGAFKPDPALFEAGADRLAVDPSVVVGDSVENDVLPGNAAGYRTVLYRGEDERADACLPGPDAFARLLEFV